MVHFPSIRLIGGLGRVMLTPGVNTRGGGVSRERGAGVLWGGFIPTLGGLSATSTESQWLPSFDGHELLAIHFSDSCSN